MRNFVLMVTGTLEGKGDTLEEKAAALTQAEDALGVQARQLLANLPAGTEVRTKSLVIEPRNGHHGAVRVIELGDKVQVEGLQVEQPAASPVDDEQPVAEEEKPVEGGADVTEVAAG